MLEREAQHHCGIAGCTLDVLPAFAAVDEDFTRRAVGIETNGDRERLVPEPQVEGLCSPTPGKDSPHSAASSTSLPHASHPARGAPRQFNSIFGTFGKYCSIISRKHFGFSECASRGDMIAESHCSPGAGHTGLPRVPINRISCLDLFQ
jgi:hypothetical protein